jgi:hypothetical protein
MRAAYWLQPPGAARAQQALARLDLRELEYRARTPALFLRALDELIVGVFGEPTSTAF